MNYGPCGAGERGEGDLRCTESSPQLLFSPEFELFPEGFSVGPPPPRASPHTFHSKSIPDGGCSIKADWLRRYRIPGQWEPHCGMGRPRGGGGGQEHMVVRG